MNTYGSIWRVRPLLVLVLSLLFVFHAIQNTIAQRHQTRTLTESLQTLEGKSRVLADERRGLFVEYNTLTDYRRLRAAAVELDLREPRLQDGSLLFLPRKNKP
ncbi:MAG: cell division protein FtsL [Gammaproteobacteria bacterium WSBS_2016_MAG_OTU1]